MKDFGTTLQNKTLLTKLKSFIKDLNLWFKILFWKKKWIPAINRFRKVIDEYDTTIYAEEALHRLVEVYYTIGLTGEAQKFAKLLGYNYQSSDWYEKSYIIFDNKYELNKKNKDKGSNKKNYRILKKIKSLVSQDE